MILQAYIQKVLAWRLFSRRDDVLGSMGIIKWWELRRIAFNAVVGVSGIVTLAVIVLVASISSDKFGDALGMPNPMIVVLAVIVYGIGANVCFTGGWITEIVVRKIWQSRAGAFPEIAFALGLFFSVVLTLTPGIFFSVLLIWRFLHR